MPSTASDIYKGEYMDYEALSKAAVSILSQSEDIGEKLASKFDELQTTYEAEMDQIKPSGEQMKQAFNL